MGKNISDLFGIKKPIISRVYISGDYGDNNAQKAIEEIYELADNGVDGVIIKDIEASPGAARYMFKRVGEEKKSGRLKLKVGVNFYLGPCTSFRLTGDEYQADFIQFDNAQDPDTVPGLYESLRKDYNNIPVIWGVQLPNTKTMVDDFGRNWDYLKTRCEAILLEDKADDPKTPFARIKELRQQVGNFPLFLESGMNKKNIYERLIMTDGAIIEPDDAPEVMSLIKDMRRF